VNLIQKLKFYFFYRKNTYPHPLELKLLLQKGIYPLSGRIKSVAADYALKNLSLLEIAEKEKCTRERIRQILCKARRQLKYKTWHR